MVVAFLIPTSAGAALAAALPEGPTDVTVKVKAHGRFGDDTEFDTAEFPVPVSVQQKGELAYTCATDPPTLAAVCPQQGQAPAMSSCE